MRIAFDAKRAFCNPTGLGQYSRTLINSLIEHYPDHNYFLCTPKNKGYYQPADTEKIKTLLPTGIYKNFTSFWRSVGVKKVLKEHNVDLYHGLSHEIPIGINDTGIKTVVTMHDLIFERYPSQYKKADVAIYRKKFRYASQHSDKIIAISKQTKNDLVEIYNIYENKIEVCYQSCQPIFQQELSNEQLSSVRKKYNLPEEYLLYVGSVIERKNLLNICKALSILLNEGYTIPLVVIGSGKEYMHKVKQYLAENGLTKQVIFLSEQQNGIDSPGVRAPIDMPAIYQNATAFLYPSVFEGFGIPVLEALWSKTPTITSNLSCMPETGGDAAYYVDPYSEQEIADAIKQVVTNSSLRNNMITKGIEHAYKFTPESCANSVMDVYTSVL